MTSTYLLTAALVASLSPPPPALTTTLLRADVEEPVDDGTADGVAAEDMAEEPEDAALDDDAAGQEEPEEAALDDAASEADQEAEAPKEITIPSKKGTGALIAAGVLGGFAISMMGLRVARIKRFCTTSGDIDPNSTITEDDLDQITSDAANCFIAGRGANAALWVFQAAPNAAAYGLAPAGALRRAKYDAAVSVASGDDSRNPGAFIGAGAALLGVGVTGRIIVAVLRIRSLNPLRGVAASCVVNDSTLASDFFDCYGDRNALLYGAHQLTASSIAAGAGLLTYGIAYKREREAIRTVYGLDKQTAFEFSVQPQLALTYTGAAATLRF